MKKSFTAKEKISCYVFFDAEKVGTANQCLALARSLGLSFIQHPLVLKYPWPWVSTRLWASPQWVTKEPLPTLDKERSLLIGGGRHSAGILARLKRLHGEHVCVVQILKGNQRPQDFDVLISPHHDGIKGKNVISTLGAVVWMDAQAIHKAAKNLMSFIAQSGIEHSSPYLGVMVGGTTKHYTLDKKAVNKICCALNLWRQQTGGTGLITTSRRTDPSVIMSLQTWAAHNDCFFAPWGERDNVYLGILGIADQFLVTQDSISMVSECAFFGKPLYVQRLFGRSKKFTKFYCHLTQAGHAIFFDGQYDFKAPVRLNEGKKITKYLYQHFQSFLP